MPLERWSLGQVDPQVRKRGYQHPLSHIYNSNLTRHQKRRPDRNPLIRHPIILLNVRKCEKSKPTVRKSASLHLAVNTGHQDHSTTPQPPFLPTGLTLQFQPPFLPTGLTLQLQPPFLPTGLTLQLQPRQLAEASSLVLGWNVLLWCWKPKSCTLARPDV